RVVAHHEEGAPLGQVLEAPHLGPEPRRVQLQRAAAAPDEPGVPFGTGDVAVVHLRRSVPPTGRGPPCGTNGTSSWNDSSPPSLRWSPGAPARSCSPRPL